MKTQFLSLLFFFLLFAFLSSSIYAQEEEAPASGGGGGSSESSFLLGYGFGSHSFSSDDSLRKGDSSNDAIEVASAGFFLLEYQLSSSIALISFTWSVVVEEDTTTDSFVAQGDRKKRSFTISGGGFGASFLTGPYKDDPRFGASIARGSASYVYELQNSEKSVKGETEGTSTLAGLFVDFGNEAWGIRLGYNQVWTEFEDMTLSGVGSEGSTIADEVVKVDADGSQLYFLLRYVW